MTTAQLEKTIRAVDEVATSQVAPVGTFTVRRALPCHGRHSVGPWVFLDHFGPFRVKPGEDGVGAHPHAGIETVTYLLSGRQEHRDSAGHVGVVAAGGAQWMTSGRGIIHAEHPLAENEAELTLHGIQLRGARRGRDGARDRGRVRGDRGSRLDAHADPPLARIARAGREVFDVASQWI